MIDKEYFLKEYNYLKEVYKNIESLKKIFKTDEIKFLDDFFWEHLTLLIKAINPNINEDMYAGLIFDFINSECDFINYDYVYNIYKNEDNPFINPYGTERIYKNELYEYISKIKGVENNAK